MPFAFGFFTGVGEWFHYYGTTKITLKSARCLWRNFISLLPLWVKRLIDGDGEVLLYVLKLYTEGGIPGVGKPLHIERRANMCWPNIGEQVTGKATPTPWLERRGAHSHSSPGSGGAFLELSEVWGVASLEVPCGGTCIFLGE